MSASHSSRKINRSLPWDPFFYRTFGGFSSILSLWQRVEGQFLERWPNIADYNEMAQLDATKKRSVFIEQQNTMSYEEEIYLHRWIPTRLSNWHDFFNNLTWLCFPETKGAMLEITYRESLISPTKLRTSKQNALAHFDECGMIFCSDEPKFFEMIKQFAWKTLFWQEREALLAHCFPIIIGHGILEKGLSPYLGMTTKTIFLNVSSDFLTLPTAQKIKSVDKILADKIRHEHFLLTPKALMPFPVLGWPHWDPLNHTETYYENRNYFRLPKNERI